MKDQNKYEDFCYTIGPTVSIPAAVKSAGLELSDIDIFEIFFRSGPIPLENRDLYFKYTSLYEK